jgi:hypothetical protein
LVQQPNAGEILPNNWIFYEILARTVGYSVWNRHAPSISSVAQAESQSAKSELLFTEEIGHFTFEVGFIGAESCRLHGRSFGVLDSAIRDEEGRNATSEKKHHIYSVLNMSVTDILSFQRQTFKTVFTSHSTRFPFGFILFAIALSHRQFSSSTAKLWLPPTIITTVRGRRMTRLSLLAWLVEYQGLLAPLNFGKTSSKSEMCRKRYRKIAGMWTTSTIKMEQTRERLVSVVCSTFGKWC